VGKPTKLEQKYFYCILGGQTNQAGTKIPSVCIGWAYQRRWNKNTFTVYWVGIPTKLEQKYLQCVLGGHINEGGTKMPYCILDKHTNQVGTKMLLLYTGWA
jgi:hypothetical protein